MQWDTGQIFEILAVGNGYFMYRVFVALAMMWSSGVFASLGGLGLLIGLLAMGAQTVSSGGQKMDIGALFTGFIMWAILFAGGASVQITEVGFMRPGSTGANSYVVDDVPFGVAATGWVITTVGKEITEMMEQAYGLVGEEQSVLKTGHGRSLEWLAAVRLASDINIGSNDNQFSVMRANLISYMRYCSVQAVVRDPERAGTMPYTGNPLDPNTGFGFESEWVTTDWYTYTSPTAKPTLSQVTCTVATERLTSYFASGSGQAFRDFANTVARPIGYTGETDADQQAVDAAASLNVSLDQAQSYMLGSVMSGLWSEAISGSPLLTDQQIANRIMITQAVEQRATEAAGEESMFRRTMYPLMTFLESTFYITAPFMALAIGLGRLGLSMAMKFALVSLWLGMWLPTLAVINMFQIVSFESAFDAIVRTYAGSDAQYQIGSVAASTHIQSSVMDWLATGSMLAAATPMISLMFLMGSAYTATSLAGTFKGGDVINERGPTPDVASAAPAIQRSGIMTHSYGAGSTGTGTDVPSFKFGGSSTIESSRQYQAAEQSITDFAMREGKQVASALTSDMMAGVRASDRNDSRASKEQGEALQALKDSKVTFGATDQDSARMMLAFGAHMAGKGSIGTGSIASSIEGLAAKANAGDANAGRMLSSLGKMVNVGVEGGVISKDETQQIAEGTTRLAREIGTAMNQSSSVRAAVTNANTSAVESFGQVSGTDSARLTGSDDWSKSRRDLSSASETFSQGQRYQEMAGSSQNMTVAQVAQGISHGGMAASAVQSAIETHGAPALQDAKNSLQGKIKDLPTGQHSADGREITQRDVAAAAMVLNGTAPSDNLNQENIGQGKMQLMQLMTASGTLNTTSGGGAYTSSPPSQGSLGAQAEANRGSAAQEVNDQNLGAAPGTEARASGGFSSMTTSEGRAGAMATAGGWGLPVGTAMAGGAEGSAYRGGDGASYDGSNFASDSGAVKEAGQQQLDAGYERGQQILSERTRQVATESNTADYQGGGSAQTGSSRIDGMRNMAAGNTVDNGDVASSIAAAGDGQYTGAPLSSAEATVVGTYRAAAGNGAPLSEQQASNFAAAYESLSPGQQAGVDKLLGKWDSDSPQPESVPVSSRSDLGRAFTLEDAPASSSEVVQGPANQARHMDMSSGPAVTSDNWTDSFNHFRGQASMQMDNRAVREGESDRKESSWQANYNAVMSGAMPASSDAAGEGEPDEK